MARDDSYEAERGSSIRVNLNGGDTRAVKKRPIRRASRRPDTQSFMGVYDEEEYNPYRDFGREIDNDPDWGYDNYDTYDEGLADDEYDKHTGGSANGYVDDMLAEPPERRMMRLPHTNSGERVYDIGRDYEDDGSREYADGTRSIGRHTNNHAPQWEQASSSDEDKYLEYLDRYDMGDIDNYEMSRIQRRYANSPFWETFRPSDELIEQYGSGNESTRWPMFERRGGRWRPLIWRND